MANVNLWCGVVLTVVLWYSFW